MANQFTSGGGSKGPKKHHDEASKDKMRAEYLARRMFKFAKAKGDQVQKLSMSSAQVQAAKVLIERGKPALQAIEQKTISPWEEMSPLQMEETAKALITAHPELLKLFQPGPRPLDDGSESQEALPEGDKRSAA